MNVTRPNLSLVVGLSQAEEKVPASLGTLLCPLRFFYQIVFFLFLHCVWTMAGSESLHPLLPILLGYHG